jgi:protein-tyrosine phosphatase
VSTKLYWTNGPWPGKLALAARPRGGDWLEDELKAWRNAGIDTVLSLLTREEVLDLNLQNEQREAINNGMMFISLPIPDRQVPSSESDVKETVEELDSELSAGKNVVIHCRQGIGRTGLLAACLLISKGFSSGAAVETVSEARGLAIPETPEQRSWIDHYAASFASAK